VLSDPLEPTQLKGSCDMVRNASRHSTCVNRIGDLWTKCDLSHGDTPGRPVRVWLLRPSPSGDHSTMMAMFWRAASLPSTAVIRIS
jgi:hypothetical protein